MKAKEAALWLLMIPVTLGITYLLALAGEPQSVWLWGLLT